MTILEKHVLGKCFGKGVGVGSPVDESWRELFKELIVHVPREGDHILRIVWDWIDLLVDVHSIAIAVRSRHVDECLTKFPIDLNNYNFVLR